MPLGEWLKFLRAAQRAGAADDTAVAEVTAWQDDSVIIGYKVEVSSSSSATSEPADVSLPTWLVHDLLSVVREVAQSDGDVRGLEGGARSALQAAYDHLLMPVLGENPYSEEPGKSAQAS
jgi:hypothetical protein